MGEPSGKDSKEKSHLGRKGEVGSRADENAEREPDDCADPDCGSSAQGIHPIHAAHAFHAKRNSRCGRERN